MLVSKLRPFCLTFLFLNLWLKIISPSYPLHAGIINLSSGWTTLFCNSASFSLALIPRDNDYKRALRSWVMKSRVWGSNPGWCFLCLLYLIKLKSKPWRRTSYDVHIREHWHYDRQYAYRKVGWSWESNPGFCYTIKMPSKS